MKGVNVLRRHIIPKKHMRKALMKTEEVQRLHETLMVDFELVAKEEGVTADTAGAYLQALASLGMRTSVREDFKNFIAFKIKPNETMYRGLLTVAVTGKRSRHFDHIMASMKDHNIKPSKEFLVDMLWEIQHQAKTERYASPNKTVSQGTLRLLKRVEEWLVRTYSKSLTRDDIITLMSCVYSLASLAKYERLFKGTKDFTARYAVIKGCLGLSQHKLAMNEFTALTADPDTTQEQRMKAAVRILAVPIHTKDVRLFHDIEDAHITPARPTLYVRSLVFTNYLNCIVESLSGGGRGDGDVELVTLGDARLTSFLDDQPDWRSQPRIKHTLIRYYRKTDRPQKAAEVEALLKE